MILAPSILSADFAKMTEELAVVEAAANQVGTDAWVHVDVMDGHFVPNLTFGPPLIKKWRPHTTLPFDVHLMIANAEESYGDYIEAGADWLTVHVEAVKDAPGILKKIREKGAKPGISLKPKTPVEDVLPLLPLVDLVLVMTVEPGFGGQGFMADQVEKVAILRQAIDESGREIRLSVDGGIAPGTIGQVKQAGADVFVAGSAVFKDGKVQENMETLLKNG